MVIPFQHLLYAIKFDVHKAQGVGGGSEHGSTNSVHTTLAHPRTDDPSDAQEQAQNRQEKSSIPSQASNHGHSILQAREDGFTKQFRANANPNVLYLLNGIQSCKQRGTLALPS
jgi:hypothetical protein